MFRLILVVLTAFTMPGCLFVPYAFPTFSHRPELQLNSSSDQVLAIWGTRTYDWNAIFLSAGPQETYEAKHCKLLTHSDMSLKSQSSIGVAYGIAGFYSCPMALFLPLPGFTITKQEPMLILYRPGYRLKRIYGWSDQSVIEWEKVVAVEEQQNDLFEIEPSAFHSSSNLRFNKLSTKELSNEDKCTFAQFLRLEWLRLGLNSTD